MIRRQIERETKSKYWNVKLLVILVYFEGMQIKLEDNLLMVETIADEPLQQIASKSVFIIDSIATINTKYENSYNQTQVQT